MARGRDSRKPKIVENKSIRSLWRLDEVLLPVENLDFYRPVLNFSLALCYGVGGLDVGPYHVLNLGIHLAAALTLFGLLRRTLLLCPNDYHLHDASMPLAFVASLLWMYLPLAALVVTAVVGSYMACKSASPTRQARGGRARTETEQRQHAMSRSS